MGICDDFVAVPSSLEVEAVVELSSSSVAFWAWVVEEPHVEVLVMPFVFDSLCCFVLVFSGTSVSNYSLTSSQALFCDVVG